MEPALAAEGMRLVVEGRIPTATRKAAENSRKQILADESPLGITERDDDGAPEGAPLQSTTRRNEWQLLNNRQ